MTVATNQILHPPPPRPPGMLHENNCRCEPMFDIFSIYLEASQQSWVGSARSRGFVVNFPPPPPKHQQESNKTFLSLFDLFWLAISFLLSFSLTLPIAPYSTTLYKIDSTNKTYFRQQASTLCTRPSFRSSRSTNRTWAIRSAEHLVLSSETNKRAAAKLEKYLILKPVLE